MPKSKWHIPCILTNILTCALHVHWHLNNFKHMHWKVGWHASYNQMFGVLMRMDAHGIFLQGHVDWHLPYIFSARAASSHPPECHGSKMVPRKSGQETLTALTNPEAPTWQNKSFDPRPRRSPRHCIAGSLAQLLQSRTAASRQALGELRKDIPLAEKRNLGAQLA